MKHKIKFKAWVKGLDEMFDVISINFQKRDVTVKFETHDTPLTFSLSDVELLQFINRTDSKGREIYEGDIIEYENGNCGYGRPREQELSKYLVPKIDNIDWDYDFHSAHLGWYVGNKFENPELIKYCTNIDAQCSKCRWFDTYGTGADEYPPLTQIATCNKGHWENGDPNADWDEIHDCIDYEKKQEKDESN